MVKFKNLKWIGAMLLAAVLVAGCKNDDADGIKEFKVTQADLDVPTMLIKSFKGGNFAHGFSNQALGDSTIRDVYGASSQVPSSVPTGTVITKRTWKADANGNNTGMMTVSFAMVKREAGYWPEGGDWEYVMMPFDANNDYTAHPNGMLPADGSDGRGKLESCKGCHMKAGGGDMLFIND